LIRQALTKHHPDKIESLMSGRVTRYQAMFLRRLSTDVPLEEIEEMLKTNTNRGAKE